MPASDACRELLVHGLVEETVSGRDFFRFDWQREITYGAKCSCMLSKKTAPVHEKQFETGRYEFA